MYEKKDTTSPKEAEYDLLIHHILSLDKMSTNENISEMQYAQKVN